MEHGTTTLTKSQNHAWEVLCDPHFGWKVLKGYAGTGKTFLVAKLAQKWATENRNINFQITAPTHKALRVLKSKLPGIPSDKFSTIHSFLELEPHISSNGDQVFKRKNFKGGHSTPKASFCQLLVVDEASMVNKELLGHIRQSLQGKNVLFVGDPFQIPPVNETLSKTFNAGDVLELTEPVRQAEESRILSLATELRTKPKVASPLPSADTWKGEAKDLVIVNRKDRMSAQDWLLEEYRANYFDNPDHIRYLAWTNDKVAKANKIIRNYLFDKPDKKFVPGEILVANSPIIRQGEIVHANNTEFRVEEVEEVQEYYNNVTYNCYLIKVVVISENLEKEYELRVIHDSSEKQLSKEMNLIKKEAMMLVGYARSSRWADFYSLKQYFDGVSHAYALTCHKSQGSTYHTAVVDNTNIERNPNISERNQIRYTAITRASNTTLILN